MRSLQPASVPTMYFMGVSTGQSSIMRLFPQWARVLGIEAQLVGWDIPLDASTETYRELVSFIKQDPLSKGALVTTHKIHVLAAARDLFDQLDPYAELFDEISCIAKNPAGLVGFAKDPISSRLAMEAFIPNGFWRTYQGEAMIMGAGGSSRAIAASLLDPKRKGDNPVQVHVTDTQAIRIQEMQTLFVEHPLRERLHLYGIAEAADHEWILNTLPPFSLVVNATGLGKDQPGSPLPDAAQLPGKGLVWELNYRGSLEFLHQAEAQKEQQQLTIVDGWEYFIHGWTQVIAEVFGIQGIQQYVPNIKNL